MVECGPPKTEVEGSSPSVIAFAVQDYPFVAETPPNSGDMSGAEIGVIGTRTNRRAKKRRALADSIDVCWRGLLRYRCTVRETVTELSGKVFVAGRMPRVREHEGVALYAEICDHFPCRQGAP